MKIIFVLMLVTVAVVAVVGFYAIELSHTNKITQYTPQPNMLSVLINDTSGKLIDNTRQSIFGSSINLEEPSYLPPNYKVQQIRDDIVRNGVNMYLSMLKINDKTTYADLVFKDGGIVIYVNEYPSGYDQTSYIESRIDRNYPHSVVDGKDFFYNTGIKRDPNDTWDIPTYVEMYDKQIEIEAYGFISHDELIKIVKSIKYDQPTTPLM